MLPPKPFLRAVRFADGVDGYAVQEYRSDEYGITMKSVRENRRSPFVQTWTIDTLPGMTFESYRQLYLAVMNGGKPCDHANSVNRRRMNADGDGVAFIYKHCDDCGHNEFVSGRQQAYDAALKSESLN